MKLNHRQKRYSVLFAVGLLFCLLPVGVWGNPLGNPRLTRVYHQMAALEGYTFSSKVQQTTHPLPTIANIGLSSRQETLLLTGQVDNTQDLRQLTIHEQSGYLLDGAGAVEMKLQHGVVWGRFQGRAWEQIDPAAAPDPNTSDPAAFLQATRNVQWLGAEMHVGEPYQIYTFDLDGAAWAAVMRDALQTELMRRGELAPHQLLDALPYYEKMSGQGEVWLNAAGLLQRLTVHVVYPPLAAETEYRELEITTDYSQWRHAMPLTSRDGWQTLTHTLTGALPTTPAAATGSAALLTLLLCLGLLPVALIRYRASLRLYRVTVLLLIGLLLSEPLLNSAVVQATSERREARLATLDEKRAENDRVQAAIDKVKADFAGQFNPQQGLLNQRQAETALAQTANLEQAQGEGTAAGILYAAAVASDPDSDGDRLTDKQEADLKTDPNKKDSDGDGLDDGTEYNTLGLDPTDPDSDGDLLSDGFEVTGIQLAGKSWYLDPLQRDTNNDNLLDSVECIQAIDVVVSPSGKGVKGAPKGTGLCDDSDNDGTPDFADDDNDNDGVWDWLDGQPQARFGDLTSGVKENVFAFGVEHYTVGKPLRLTFELRPTNPQHLWYSMNVLDWPSEDYEGQIRRVHDTKLGSNGALANGDMQLVPMVEVTLPAADAIHLPTIPGKQPIVGENARLAEWLDMPVLERYQMAVSWTPDKQSLRLYLPATLIRDTRSNGPLNFTAKLLYIPNGNGLFSTNHLARLVWLVQLDTDACVPPSDSNYQDSCLPQGKNYQNGLYWQTNKQQIVHRYYDSFYLNAFTAEEDLGANAQIFYENPAQIANKGAYLPDQLLGFGHLLELYLRQNKSPVEALQAYQAKSPQSSNRITSSALVQDPDSFGLLAKVATQVAPDLLDNVFEPHKDQLPYPTLLYVTWGQSKINGLEGISTADALRLDMVSGTLKSGTAVRVGTFAYNPTPSTIGGKPNPNWSAVEPGAVWNGHFKTQSLQAYQQLPAPARQKVDVDRFQQSALSLYWNLARGVDVTGSFESAFKEGNEKANGFIDEVGAAGDNLGNNTIAAMAGVLDDFAEAPQAIANLAASNRTGNAANFLAKLAGKDVKNVANVKGALTSSKWARGVGTTAVAMAGLSATVSLVLAFQSQLGLSEGAVTALEGINATVGAVLAGLQVAQEITKVVQNVQAFSGTTMQGLSKALQYANQASSVGFILAAVVVAVIVVAALIMFFKLRSDGNPVAAKTALAQGLSTALVVTLLFVISLFFPIGTAIAAIIGLLDGIFTAICKIANWIGGKDADGNTFEDRNKTFCSGIVGNTVAAIAGVFYRTQPMVDMGYSGRLKFGQTDTKLVERNGLTGMSAGNQLDVKQAVTTTVRIPDAHSMNPRNPLSPTQVYSNLIAIDGSLTSLMPLSEYDRLIKEKSLFNYELVPITDTEKSTVLASQTTPSAWKSFGDINSRNRLYKGVEATLQVTLTPGINWKPDLLLREYYQFPLAECGLFAGGCDDKVQHFSKNETGAKEILDIGKDLIYDVFPSTLTEFYTLEQVQESGQFVNRYRLNWGGSDKPFPTLLDADGDGLRSDGTGALDPDDKTGDKDLDGLPDAFEVQDYRLNPSASDSDNDGLNDYQEIRYGTRPDRADSDNDGLNDGDELAGWEFVYADADNVTKRTWVTSDPLLFDSDGDGFSDQQERVFAFHPRARTIDPKILSLRTSTNQTNSTWLAPQQSIAFTATVKNELRKPIAYGLLEAEILNSTSVINPVTFELQPQQSTNVRGAINVPATPPVANPAAANHEITLRNRAGANLVDPSTSYASLLQGLAQADGLKFLLNFEQRPSNPNNFPDATGKATLTCPAGSYCPTTVYSTDSYGRFNSQHWYVASGNELAFTQPKFSLGGWVTLRKAFGGKYDERVIFGPDNVEGAVGNYLQLSVVNLNTTPKAKVSFTATDGARCEQVLTELTVPMEQKTHLFVTYDGTLLRGYRNGVEVGNYNLQNCANKIPAGNRFTIGRGASHATLYVYNVYFIDLDEGSPWSAEPYLQLDGNTDRFWDKTRVKNGDTPNVGAELNLRDSSKGDADNTVYVCEEDNGTRQGRCRSDAVDADDYLGQVAINPRVNGESNSFWSSGEGRGYLRYNVQNNFFNGDLDDLRIYEATLSARDVSQLVSSNGLLYQLDEASGRTQFRNAGTDSTQLLCSTPGNCPTSGLKGYTGQAVRFTGNADQTLRIEKLRQRFGSNFITSFWWKPESTPAATTSLLRSGQGSEGYMLLATNNGTTTALNARFAYADVDPIGGSGGNSYDIRCNDTEALVGIYGGAGSLVDRVGALCVAIDGNGNWQGTPTQRGTAGGSGGNTYERLCASGSAVVGFSGRSGSLIDRITLQCAKLQPDGYTDVYNRTALDGVGGGGGTTQAERVCPSNLPALGIRGRAGRLVDSFGLTCRTNFAANRAFTLPNGQWSHVALAQNNDTLWLYINGEPRQNLWFGPSLRADYRLNGNYTVDLLLGGQLQGLLDEVQIQGLTGETSLANLIRKPYLDSALVYLPLDEVSGSTSFDNSTGKGNLTCADVRTCPQSGVKGQVRESVQFGGQGNPPSLTIGDQRSQAFSFAAWVKVPSMPQGTASLIALHNGMAEPAVWRLQLDNVDGKIIPTMSALTSADGNSCGNPFTVTPNVTLALNQWYHLGVSYDPLNGKNDLNLYLNGQLVHQQRLSSLLCRVGDTLRFGQNFKGQLDEFVFYTKPLALTEFLSQYVYQNTWFDVVTNEKFSVDYNAPTVKLTTNRYLKAGTNIFGAAVSDAESGIKTVEYRDNDGLWKSARAETTTAGVWTFALDVQGNRTVEVRATDNVGNVRSDAQAVNVDTTPPVVALTTSGKQTALVVTGTASDSGSGLQSATIMLFDPLGNPLNSPRDLAVKDGVWRYSQALPPLVNGTFQVWVAAVDQLGNRTAGIIGTVAVDNAPPVLGLITDRVTYGGIGNNTPVLKGYVTDQPYPDGMQLLLGFEELGPSGPIGQAADLSGNQWQAVPLPGTAAPTVVLSAPAHQADFQLGQTLVISNANRTVARTLLVDPNSATLALWLNPASVAPAVQQVIGQDDEAGFAVLLKGDQVTLRINRNGAALEKDTGQRVVAGQWQLLTLTFERTAANEQTITTWLNSRGSATAGKPLTLTGGELIQKSTKPLLISAATNGYVGKLDDLLLYGQPLRALEVGQLSIANPSTIQKVDVGFLHRQDRAAPNKVLWQPATLDAPAQGDTTWQVTLPAGLEGIYDISLRTTDALNNQRVLGGVWTGVIDTLAPRLVLSGTVAGTHQCVVTDFSLSKSKFICADAQTATGATEADYGAEALPSAGLQWDAGWYKTFFAQNRLPARLYALQLTGRNFFSATNTAESCDLYGNCARCTVSGNNLAAPLCTTYAANALPRTAVGGQSIVIEITDDSAADEWLTKLEPLGPANFTMTVAYERPDVYVPGTEPATPTSEWVAIDEPYTLIDDAVLASTRPFAASFTAAATAITWNEAVSATAYYVGWTISETVVISDLTAYTDAGRHFETLPDRGRYYAHVVAVDNEGNENGYTLGPIYFDSAPPASYLNWDEDGPGQPYRLWQAAETATGQLCHLLGFEDRVAIFSNGASPRSGEQLLFGTWSDDWLALHWQGVNVNDDGDLHLYVDTKPGGARYAYNPYQDVAHATALVTMPERRQYQSNTTDPLLADYAVIVEDATTLRLLQWDGNTWQPMNATPVKFSYAEGETMIWLPLSLLGITPPAVDLSLVGFVTEENAMEVWATMPGNNPLNSPQMLPAHLTTGLAVGQTLLNLQTSIRLTNDANINNTLDNCPTNVLFDESLLDIQFMADPAGEIYDPVVYEGLRAVIPDDVETVLATLCTGVSDTTNSPVCQLAQQVAANSGGGGPAVGPFGLLPATAGPQDQLTFYATVRNLSSQYTGDLVLDVVGDLPGNGSTLPVGALAPFASTVISFTATVDPNAAYDFTEMTIYPVEEVDSTEEVITLTYEHTPHTVIHDIDRTAPISAALTSDLFVDGAGRRTVGVGSQELTGLVFDQSPLAELKLETSLGETVICPDTVQSNAFSNTWRCAIQIPAATLDGAPVTVKLSATDVYSHGSGVIGTWDFIVDHALPQLTLSGPAAGAVQGGTTQPVTETLVLDGWAGDDRLLGGVEVCDGLQGYATCQDATLYTLTDEIGAKSRPTALAGALADEAYWVVETTLAPGLETVQVPYTMTVYDAFGNATQQTLQVVIDTLPPTVTLDAPPASELVFGGNFALSGLARDKGNVSQVVLQVVNPLGEYATYTATLDAPQNSQSQWRYTLQPGTTHFALPGQYSYFVVATDAFGNEAELGPYPLTVAAPTTALNNTPFIVSISNDLWSDFAPGAQLYTKVYFDDLDLALGDQITVTAKPLPTWLTWQRLDEQSLEISGTVPLTITQVITAPVEPDASPPITDTGVVTPVLSLSVGLVLTDSTGRQALQTWSYEEVLSTPTSIFLPMIAVSAVTDASFEEKLPLYLPLIQQP